MPRSHIEVETQIVKLEQRLRKAMLWSNTTPSLQALESEVPFAFDSMPFEQWLQFIFIPKMSELVNAKNVLPNTLKLLPMAEQCLGNSDNHRPVLDVITQIDLIFEES